MENIEKLKALTFFLVSTTIFLGDIVTDFANGFNLILRQESSEINATHFCQTLEYSSHPVYGGLAVGFIFLPHLFSAIFVLANGGYYPWAAASLFFYWPFAIYSLFSAFVDKWKGSDTIVKSSQIARIVLLPQCWLQASPQLVIQFLMIGHGITPGPIQIISLAFSTASVIMFTMFFKYGNVMDTMREQNQVGGQQENWEISFKTKLSFFIRLSLIQTLSAAYRIALVVTLIYFFKVLSIVAIGLMIFAQIALLTLTKGSHFVQSVITTFAFLSPFQLNLDGGKKKIDRMSTHSLTVFGSLSLLILFVCHHYNITTDSNYLLGFYYCDPDWVTENVYAILSSVLSMGIIYSIVTEIYVRHSS